MEQLAGKKVLVTGGGSGIGLGIARALASEGCRVAIAGRSEAKLRQAASQFTGEHPILAHACDVSQPGDVHELFAWLAQQGLEPLDILVLSAGINVQNRRIADLDPADWDRIMAINATGAFHTIYAALPGMRASAAA